MNAPPSIDFMSPVPTCEHDSAAMPDDDWNHDEAWSDDEDDDLDDGDDSGPCPECGTQISSLTDKCPACGYWLTDADLRSTRPHDVRPTWVKITAVIALTAMLLSILYTMLVVF